MKQCFKLFSFLVLACSVLAVNLANAAEGVSPQLVKVDLNETNNGLERIEKGALPSMRIPHYLELGELDNGTLGTDFYAYVLKEGAETLGYVLDYWYANDEGQWATRYTLKFNENGVYLEDLTKKEDRKFCDYPFFDEKPRYCQWR